MVILKLLCLCSDDHENKSGFSNACEFINTQMTQFFAGKELPLPKKNFDQLASWVERQRNKIAQQYPNPPAEEGEEVKENEEALRAMARGCNSYAVRSCLEALWYAYGHSITPEMPLASQYRNIWSKEMTPTTIVVPKLMFTIFNGGKALGSKVRFSRFYIIMNLRVQDVEIDANVVYYKIAAAVKKAITSHKLGEAGFKANLSGSYYNALDTINDSFKMLEEAINSTGLNTNERKVLMLGINADSASVFQEETGKYDIEGPKNLFDQTMLADWFVKLAQDHPLLAYIEDPFADGDVLGYQKILRRFKDTQVKIGVKNWFGSDLAGIQEFTQFIQEESEEEPEEQEIDEETKRKQEEEEEEKRRQEEEEAAAAAAAAANTKGKAAAANAKKGQPEVEVVDPDIPDANDPNA